METAVLYEPHAPLIIEDLELNQPDYGEVRIKLQASGVCHSDWHIIKGEWTHVPLPVIRRRLRGPGPGRSRLPRAGVRINP